MKGDNIYRRRWDRLRGEMKTQGTDMAVFGQGSSMNYFCRLNIPPDDRPEFLIIPREGDPYLLLSSLYQNEGARLNALSGGLYEARYQKSLAEAERELKDWLPKKDMAVAVDSRLWTKHFLRLRSYFSGKTRFSDADILTAPIREVKDEEEIALLKEAGRAAAAAFLATLPQIRLDIKETELAGILEYEMKKAGGEGLSFPTIIAFGANGAEPHHVPGDTRLARDQFIVMDFGCTVGGYASDITRTVVFGKADEQMRRVYQAVTEALCAARNAVKARATAKEVEKAARAELEKYSLEQYFIHSIGHGVGLDVHENPRFGLNSETRLAPGMVFSLEPGVYLPGRFGIRVEDVVAVRKEGFTDLHILDKSLIELD